MFTDTYNECTEWLQSLWFQCEIQILISTVSDVERVLATFFVFKCYVWTNLIKNTAIMRENMSYISVQNASFLKCKE